MEFFKHLVFYTSMTFILFGLESQAVPVKRSAEDSNPLVYPESLGLRLGVLQDVVSRMQSNMTKYESLCKISENAKRVYQLAGNKTSESGQRVAAQHIADICSMMISHTDMDLDCDTTDSSIETIDTICNEISLYTGINQQIEPVLKAILKQIKEIPDQASFVEKFTEDLPKSARAIICAPYAC